MNPFVWLLFIVGTLIIQIVMINILIAILGDTYDNISDDRVLWAFKERTRIYCDYIHNITLDSLNTDSCLYVIRPIDDVL